ncbi:MAG: hypothetical protein K2X73_07000 [Sphingomonas sp.]|uniref:hypothetical protein n=1 Tax=Sphingomonas sp. TaxID=28214 RepID=UPI0025D89689|nr:hypothetical protein [Sphingomonas sp.]MBX9881704.1 hypothetical protein [Sphingomonas sp.]
MGRFVAIELFHIALGIGLAVLMAYGAAWAVPLARADIWTIAALAVIAIIILGVRPLARAHRRDRGHG